MNRHLLIYNSHAQADLTSFWRSRRKCLLATPVKQQPDVVETLGAAADSVPTIAVKGKVELKIAAGAHGADA